MNEPLPKENSVHIRVGRIEDAKNIADIGQRAFRASFKNSKNSQEVELYLKSEYSEAAISSVFDRSEVEFVVCEKEGVALGFAQLHLDSPEGPAVNQKYMKMERLYLDPAVIGTGAGKLLLHEAIDMARSKDCTIFWLMVLRTNDRAVRFYEKAGFKIFGESPGKFKADDEIDYWMKIGL